MWLHIPGQFNSGAEISPENHGDALNPEIALNTGTGLNLETALDTGGRGHTSAPAGIFSLRRDRYINAARLDKTGRGVRRSDIAEAAIAEAFIALRKR